ncbi:MAG: glycosyltransferase family 9 protein [Candidatus Omnitrophica bacterium]|nr:glycosyltransferase family 9 protein [Candidatus Omnitrophota bacterium]
MNIFTKQIKTKIAAAILLQAVIAFFFQDYAFCPAVDYSHHFHNACLSPRIVIQKNSFQLQYNLQLKDTSLPKMHSFRSEKYNKPKANEINGRNNYWISRIDEAIRLATQLILNKYIIGLIRLPVKLFKKHAPYKKILIVCTHGIGDTIMQTPLIELIKLKFPDAHLTALTTPVNAEILRFNTSIDQMIFYPKTNRNRFSFEELCFTIKHFFHGFDLAVLDHSGSTLRNKFLAIIFGSRYIIADSQTSPESNIMADELIFEDNKHTHRVFINLATLIKSTLKNIPPFDYSPKQSMHISNEERKFADNFLLENNLHNKKLIAVHIGCGAGWHSISKRWGVGNYSELIDRIQKKFPETSVLVFKGPYEEDENFTPFQERKGVLIVDSYQLRKVASIIERCALMIANDSGIGHMAAALNIPVISLFGPTNEFEVKPFSENAVVIRSSHNCPFCYGGKTYLKACQKEITCMKSLQTDKVFLAVEKQLRFELFLAIESAI